MKKVKRNYCFDLLTSYLIILFFPFVRTYHITRFMRFASGFLFSKFSFYIVHCHFMTFMYLVFKDIHFLTSFYGRICFRKTTQL